MFTKGRDPVLHTWPPLSTKLGQGNVFTGVCDSVNGGRCLVPGGVCFGGVPGPGGGCLLPEGCLVPGVSAPGGCLVLGGCLLRGMPGPGWVSTPGGCLLLGRCLVPGGCLSDLVETPSPRMATAAGGMHSTGMHSCSSIVILFDPFL